MADQAPNSHITLGHEGVQVGLGPAQGIQAGEHVVADGDVHGAQVIGVERECLAVVGGGDELGDSDNLA